LKIIFFLKWFQQQMILTLRKVSECQRRHSKSRGNSASSSLTTHRVLRGIFSAPVLHQELTSIGSLGWKIKLMEKVVNHCSYS
jgi:hypothetical protein